MRRHNVAKRIRVAVIGCGNVSNGHIQAWQGRSKEVEIVGLFDPVRQFCGKLKKRYKLDGATIYESYAQALDDARVDVINICSMSDVHDEQIMQAMEAGKHILTEKPTGYTVENCRKLRWYAQRYPKLLVAVAYSLRYVPVNIEVRRLVRSGAIGRPMWAHIEHNHAAGPKHKTPAPNARLEDWDLGSLSDAGGRFIAGSDMCHATHPYDLARYMMGEPRTVYATRNTCGVFTTINMTNESVCQVQSGHTAAAGLYVITPVAIQGTEGTIFTECRASSRGKPVVFTAYLMNSARKGARLRAIRAPQDTGHGDYTRVANYLDALRGKAPLICPLADSIRTSELLTAVWRSCTLGIRVGIERRGRTG